jgi:hypothetical protein
MRSFCVVCHALFVMYIIIHLLFIFLDAQILSIGSEIGKVFVVFFVSFGLTLE